MSEKKEQDTLNDESSSQIEKNVILKEKTGNKLIKKVVNWFFCPNCGSKLPKIDRLRYCTRCGIDLQYLQEHKTLPPHQQQITYPQHDYFPKYPPHQQYTRYPVSQGFFESSIEKIAEEDLTTTKNRKLWGKVASIGIPLAGFVGMNLIALGFTIIMIFFFLLFFLLDFDSLFNILTSDIFIVLTSLFELFLIVIPLIYVRKYIQKPTFKNRLILLGFSSRGYDKIGVLKEILLGLGFAIIGVFVVLFAELITQIILGALFNINFLDSGSLPTDDIDSMITSTDIIGLVLLTITMILIVGPTEEILFRGFMQKGLVRNFGEKLGILITAFVFAVIHLVTLLFIAFSSPFELFIMFIWMFVPYMSISILLGLLFTWRNENLIAVVVTHGLYNSITLILGYLAFNAPQALLIFIFVLLLTVSFSLISYYYLQNYYQKSTILL